MSLTTGERQALSWLLAVIGVGAGARVVTRFGEAGEATPAASEALRRQLVAVDSAQRAQQQRDRSSRRGSTPRRRRATPGAATGPPDGEVRREVPPERPTLVTVDVDQADSVALERLPRIGPALAARIVADRQAHGPFGSLLALQRVRGIGPKLAAMLASHVTFSGNPRPSAVQR